MDIDFRKFRNVKKVVNGLRKVVPWTIGKELLELIDVQCSTGWERTIQHIQDNFRNYKDCEWDKLFNTYYSTLIYGNKNIRPYKVDAKQKKVYLEALKRSFSEAKEGPLRKDYPFYHKPKEISPLEFVYWFDNEDGAHFVLSEIVETIERTEIPSTWLRDGFIESLNDVVQVVLKRKVLAQLYHVVFIDHKRDVVEIRSDSNLHMSTDLVKTKIAEIRGWLGSNVSASGFALNQSQAINVFPAIKGLYDSGWGRVSDMAFYTDTNSVKYERMKKDGDDLRTEVYHDSGKKGLASAESDFNIYRIGIKKRFEIFGVNFYSYISLVSYAKEVSGNSTPELKEYSIYDTISAEEFNKIRDELYNTINE